MHSNYIIFIYFPAAMLNNNLFMNYISIKKIFKQFLYNYENFKLFKLYLYGINTQNLLEEKYILLKRMQNEMKYLLL